MLIKSGSYLNEVHTHPWWVLNNDQILIGSIAVINPIVNGILKNEWAGEIVIVVEKSEQTVSSVPFYRVVCRLGSKTMPASEFRIIK